mgnify:FL=1
MISGRLGEVIKETRTLATHLNGINDTETAVMEYRSDYLGRMQWITYPDGEKITYGYDKGGQVISVTGSNYGNEFNYVTNILYDQYGQRTHIDYGNGTFTEYSYDPARRWLDAIKTQGKWGQTYQNIKYSFDAVGNVLGYENDCLQTSGNYSTKQIFSYDSLYQLIKADGETIYNPYQSSVPEFKSNYTQTFTFDSIGLGNMTSKVSSESVTPQKTIGDSLNYSFGYEYDPDFAHRLISAGNRYYQYDANGNIVCEQDGDFESGNDEETVYHKITQEADDVYSTDYGWGLFKDDDKGSGGKTSRTKYKRTYTWNERNQLVSSVDDNYSTAYVYGQDGQRSNKYTANSETLYFNKMWTHHTDSGNSVYGGQTAKNIYLGETRIVTKLNSGDAPTYNEEYYKQYYYHSDHLGSASLITDYKGDEYQRIEYTPYGENWVEKTINTGLEYLPYRFTAKELDEETGLYYYGARYLNPRTSQWISTDPALGEYIPGAGKATTSDAGSLPGMGGIFNTVNLQLYHYTGNNPVKYTDPNGREMIKIYVNQPGSGGDRDTYEYTGGKNFDTGHAFIELKENDKAEGKFFGFYPDSSQTDFSRKELILGNDVKGKVVDDSNYDFSKVDVTKEFEISNDDFKAALDYVGNIKKEGKKYNLSEFNCTDFVIEAANAAGIKLPDTQGSWPFGRGSNPGDLGEDLRNFSIIEENE